MCVCLLQLHRVSSHAQCANGIMERHVLLFLSARMRSLSDKFLLVGVPIK